MEFHLATLWDILGLIKFCRSAHTYKLKTLWLFFFTNSRKHSFLWRGKTKYQASLSFCPRKLSVCKFNNWQEELHIFFLTSCLYDNSLDCMKHPGALEPFKRYSLTLHTRPDKDTCDMKHVNNSENTYGTAQFYFIEGCESSAAAFNVRHVVFRLFFLDVPLEWEGLTGRRCKRHPRNCCFIGSHFIWHTRNQKPENQKPENQSLADRLLIYFGFLFYI